MRREFIEASNTEDDWQRILWFPFGNSHWVVRLQCGKVDLSMKFPERVAEMKAGLMVWEKEMLETLPYRVVPE